MRHPPYQPFYTSVTAPGDQTNRRRNQSRNCYGRRGSISSQRISSQQISLNQIHANNSHDSYDASSYNDRMVARGGNKIAPPNAAFGSIRDSPISISSRPQLKNSSSTNILPMRGRKNSNSWPPSSRRNGNFSPRGRARGMMLTPSNNNSRYKQRSQHQQQQSFQHNYKTEEGYEGENASPNSYDSQETYDYARERHQQQQQQQHDDVTPHSLQAADNDSSSNIRGGDIGGYAITRSIQPPDCSNLGITALAAGVSMCRTKSSKTGLDNLGNTCFINAALQCLAHTPAVADFILSRQYENYEDGNDQKIADVFAEVVNAIYKEDNGYRGYYAHAFDSSFNPDDFLEEFTSEDMAPQFGGYRQHDSHEFLRVLIDRLCDDFKDATLCRENKSPQASEAELENMSLSLKAEYWWKRHLAENSSFITETFCGQLISTIQCSVCKTNSYCFDPFYDLSLPFPNGNQNQSARQQGFLSRRASIMPNWNHSELSRCSLEDCLREFTKDEVIDGENKIECSKCRAKRTMVKRLQVYRFPKVLVLHLKRFGNTRKKVKTEVRFPIKSFDASSLACQQQANGGSNRPVYDLYAVCDHSGRMNFGHYTASCIDPQSEEWQTFNDEDVSSISASDLNGSSAYMLFYSLRDSS